MVIEVDRVGLMTKPIVHDFDSSGFRSGFGEVMIASGAAQSACDAPGAGVPFGQRTGSLAVVNAARPPSPDSAAFGARKPSP